MRFVTVIFKMNLLWERTKKLMDGKNRQLCTAGALQVFQLVCASQYHVSIQILQMDSTQFLRNGVAMHC